LLIKQSYQTHANRLEAENFELCRIIGAHKTGEADISTFLEEKERLELIILQDPLHKKNRKTANCEKSWMTYRSTPKK
jgi:IS30 family transposase